MVDRPLLLAVLLRVKHLWLPLACWCHGGSSALKIGRCDGATDSSVPAGLQSWDLPTYGLKFIKRLPRVCMFLLTSTHLNSLGTYGLSDQTKQPIEKQRALGLFILSPNAREYSSTDQVATSYQQLLLSTTAPLCCWSHLSASIIPIFSMIYQIINYEPHEYGKYMESI